MTMKDLSVFKESRLCVVGNLNRDLKAAPIDPEPTLFNDGETSVAWIVETTGGGGANCACAAAYLGAKVGFMGRVGRDALGERLEAVLKRKGIVTYLRRVENASSDTSINLTFKTGTRHFFSCLKTNSLLCLGDLDLDGLGQYEHLLRADIWFSEEMLFGGNAGLFQRARQTGLSTSIDLNWDPLWGVAPTVEIQRRKGAVRDVLPLVDLVHGNVRELTIFCDTDDLGKALTMLEKWGVGGVVVHMGSQGAGYYSRGEWIVEPPALAGEQVQTTGTGDVLSVCMMLLHRRRDMPITDQLRLANAIVARFIEGQLPLIPVLD
jgi:sugar/nucleoside kinase (ribokinase family)